MNRQRYLVLDDLLDSVDGPTLVEIATSRSGGSRHYELVEERDELARLVLRAPPSARFCLLPVEALPFGKAYYKAPGPGSY